MSRVRTCNPPGSVAGRTRARKGSPWSTRRRAIRPPRLPVAPTSRIIRCSDAASSPGLDRCAERRRLATPYSIQYDVSNDRSCQQPSSLRRDTTSRPSRSSARGGHRRRFAPVPRARVRRDDRDRDRARLARVRGDDLQVVRRQGRAGARDLGTSPRGRGLRPCRATVRRDAGHRAGSARGHPPVGRLHHRGRPSGRSDPAAHQERGVERHRRSRTCWPRSTSSDSDGWSATPGPCTIGATFGRA